MPVITILFLLRLGNFVEASFGQIVMLYNPIVYEVADVFETYIYRSGILQGDFDYTTAVGLFQNVLGVVVLVIANQIIRRHSDYGVW